MEQHMKFIIPSTFALAVSSTAALAHSDGHTFAALPLAALHLLTEPDHLAMIATSAGAVFLIRRYYKKKAL
jgi:hypothetical protein